MYRRWMPVALLAIVVLLLGLFPVDREMIAAVQRGDELAAKRQYTAALQAYELAAERCPGCPQPHVRRGKTYTTQGRYEEAWSAYLTAIQLGGASDQTAEGLARLYVAQHAEVWAVDYLRGLLVRRPGRGDLWTQLGKAYLAIGETADAQGAFERALELDIAAEQRQFIHDQLGIFYIETDAERALTHFVEVERGPDPVLADNADRLTDALRETTWEDGSALTRARLGEALFRHGDLALARRQFEAAVGLEPAYVDGHAYLGHVLSVLGEGELAVQHLEQAIALEPGYLLPYYFMGMHYVRKGWLITGREYLVQAHDLDPRDPGICVAVADTYLREEVPMYGVVERWLHAAVDNAPDDPRFHLLLAHFYVDYMIDPAVRGVAVAKVAVQLAPESSEAQETLGWAYHLAGKPDLALEPLTRARELDPDEPRIYYRLGEVYRALRQSIQAQAFYQQAIDLDWNGPIGDKARQVITQ